MSVNDLTQRSPRSPRVRLGGYVILPRCLDKCRADIAGKIGEYHFDCPLDKRFLSFVDISADELKEQVARDKGDREILEWITAHAKHKPTAWEIAEWSRYREQEVASDVEFRDFVQKTHSELAPHRSDIATLFDLLDLDDYVSFGGKP
ncbi:MAG: DUF5069 domain-containing protein [Verrucomicrobiae bacterium]|nr:DUF5069 domain-containing protein [Verrucomicrobiae bacterium]